MRLTPGLIALATALFFIATVVTQVGGFLLLVGGLIGYRWARRRKSKRTLLAATEGALTMYLFGLLLIPFISKPLGREPLPWVSTKSFPIQPRNIGYCLLFRNYVSPELAQVLRESSKKYSQRYPGDRLDYLDACFPFVDGFPLFPHLSHDDGKKVDLCFGYSKNGNPARSPSPIGYWIYEGPKKGERDPCGWSPLRWDFAWLQGFNRCREFDHDKTRMIVHLFARHPKVEKLFLEPHLKDRLGGGSKVRFQGCRAARHDDHLHIQIY